MENYDLKLTLVSTFEFNIILSLCQIYPYKNAGSWPLSVLILDKLSEPFE